MTDGKKIVYRAMTKQVVFEGTDKECMQFIFDNCFTMSDGSKIYRKWNDKFGNTYYDTDGGVFIYNDR